MIYSVKKHSIPLVFFALCGLGMACAPLQQTSKPQALELSEEQKQAQKTNIDNFLREAVLFGLKSDGFPPSLAKTLRSEPKNWVGKCPICDGVRSGISRYVSETGEATPKSKLDASTATALGQSGEKERKEALKLLIDRYTQSYILALAMTPQEISALQSKLKVGRKQGMAGASGGEGFFCASCDGACHIEIEK